MGQTTKGIKYPSEYNAVADLPADLKEMAESIDDLIAISEHDYTILEGRVTDLETEIEAFEHLTNTELDTATAEGTEITVNGSAEYYGNILPGANMEQKQLSGKNLLNLGSFSLLKSSNRGLQAEIGTELPAGTYKFSCKLSNGNLSLSYGLSIVLKDASSNNISNYLQTNQNTGEFSGTFTTTETASKIYFYISQQENDNATISLSDLQIEQGSTATEFEPYCGGQASPNPDYPQEIKVVTGDNVVRHVGKNLLDLKNGTYIATDITGVVENGVITLNGTAAANRFLVIELNANLDLINEEQYTISTNNEEANSNVRFRIDDSGSYDTILSGTNATKTIVYSNNSNLYKTRLTIRVASGTTLNNYVIKPQIEKSSTATSYEPYRGEEYELNLGYDNLIDVMPNQSEIINGIEISTTSDGYIKLNGTATNNINKSFLWLNNLAKYKSTQQQYTYSSHYESGTASANFAINLRCGQQAEDLSGQLNTTSLYVNNALRSTSFYKGNTGYVTGIQIIISSGVVLDNFVCKLQLEEGNVVHTYTKFGEKIELCKIGDYEDVLFKNEVGDENYNAELEEGAWYKKGVIGKVVFDGSEYWQMNPQATLTNTIYLSINAIDNLLGDISAGFCNYFKQYAALWSNDVQGFQLTSQSQNIRVRINNTIADSVSSFKTWLSTHNLKLYYIRAVPTYTKITNPTLISQLEALDKCKWFKGVNHWWTETNNLEPNLKGTYKQSNNLRLQALEQAVVALGGV